MFLLNDEKIISAIINRDEQMLAFAVRKYSKLLWKVAAPILVNAASAQDVEECVADVFIYLWQCPEKYDSDKGRLSAWLSMVARSKAIDRYRQIIRKRELPIEEIAEGIAADSWVYAKTETPDGPHEKLLSCIGKLDEKEKELIIRRYYFREQRAKWLLADIWRLPRGSNTPPLGVFQI